MPRTTLRQRCPPTASSIIPITSSRFWTRSRGAGGANTCTSCHNDTAKLDLRATVVGYGRLVSYEELLVGDPVIDQATGQPVTRLEDGVPVIVRNAPLVDNMAATRLA